MKNYVVDASIVIEEQVEVEAKNKKEALKKAKKMLEELNPGCYIENIEIWVED